MTNQLVHLLHVENCSCVIANGSETRTFTQRGVADLYNLVCNQPEFLRGAKIADKVVGKGAAALMIKGGVRLLHADVISLSALSLLREHNVRVYYDKCVPLIKDRSGLHQCPVEKLCSNENSIETMFKLIKDFICKQQLRDSII